LRHAERAKVRYALALACDMPFVSSAFVRRLVSAADAPIVAPRRNEPPPKNWEPLCARYEATTVLPHALRRLAAGKHALQPLLVEAGAVALDLGPAQAAELRDWDAPGDIEID
jgi:molybdopterin-guanine dinucleotide biosynthesis protein A